LSESGSGSSTVEYIQHHLTNLCVGDCDPVTHKANGFWALHLDTIFFSVLLGGLLILVSWRLTRNLSADTPGGFQNFVEIILEFVSTNVKDTFPGHNPLIALNRSSCSDCICLGMDDEFYGSYPG